MLSILSFIMGTSLADTLPQGETLESAIIADIPAEGFDSLLTMLPALIPSGIPIDDFSASSGGFCLWGYEFAMSSLQLETSINDAALIPKAGYFELAIYLDVQLNNPNSPFILDTELACIPGDCDGYVAAFPTDVVAQIVLEIVDSNQDGVNELDATIQNLSYNYSLESENIVLNNCAIATIEDILNFLGLSMYDLILSIAEPQLESLIQDLIPTLETEVESAFAAASVDEILEIGDSFVQLKVSPSQIEVAEEGLRLALDGAISAVEPAECVAGLEESGSKLTEGDTQTLSEFPPGNDAGAILRDDFINQVLYSIWQAGLVCTTVDDSVFALDTAILNLLTSDSYLEVFPDPKPMEIITAPKRPPVLNLEIDAEMGVDIEELGLQFYADLDYRTAKVLELDLSAEVGIDLQFDNTTGLIEMDLGIDPSLIEGAVSDNEITPSQNDNINANFPTQIESLLNIIDLNTLIGDLSLSIPSANGVGITAMDFTTSGEYNEDLSVYANLGEVDYPGCSAGCGEDSSNGCGETGGVGCEGGCASNGRAQGRMLFSLFVAVLAFYRRREPTQIH